MNNLLCQLNINYLQAFVATSETGSFSNAARALGKAQSVVSSAVSNLEIDLNVALFSRKKRYPELTEAGKMLLPEAKAILKRCNFFENIAYSSRSGSAIPVQLDHQFQ